MTDFASAIQADPQFAVAHAWRGAILLVQADYESAKLECDALQRLQRETLYGGCIGLHRAYTGQLEAAASALQAALNQTTIASNRLWLLVRLGEVSAWRAQPEKAERYYREALALGKTFSVSRMPQRLRELATLYGVAQLLPAAP